MTSSSSIVPSEEDDQATFVHWLELRRITFTAIPNSTYTKSWSQKAKNHRMGLRRGFPDLIVCLNKRVVCVEMKRVKGGVVSPFQAQWLEVLNTHGVESRVCRGAKQAIDFITEVSNRV